MHYNVRQNKGVDVCWNMSQTLLYICQMENDVRKLSLLMKVNVFDQMCILFEELILMILHKDIVIRVKY